MRIVLPGCLSGSFQPTAVLRLGTVGQDRPEVLNINIRPARPLQLNLQDPVHHFIGICLSAHADERMEGGGVIKHHTNGAVRIISPFQDFRDPVHKPPGLLHQHLLMSRER